MRSNSASASRRRPAPSASSHSRGAGLWFVAVWACYELVWSLTGIPRLLGPAVAAAIAAFVGVDPLILFWTRSADKASPPAMEDDALRPTATQRQSPGTTA